MITRLADFLEAVALWPDQHKVIFGSIAALVAVAFVWTFSVRGRRG